MKLNRGEQNMYITAYLYRPLVGDFSQFIKNIIYGITSDPFVREMMVQEDKARIGDIRQAMKDAGVFASLEKLENVGTSWDKVWREIQYKVGNIKPELLDFGVTEQHKTLERVVIAHSSIPPQPPLPSYGLFYLIKH